MKRLYDSAIYFGAFALGGLLFGLLLLVLQGRGLTFVGDGGDLRASDRSRIGYAPAVERAAPAVVNVYADKVVAEAEALGPTRDRTPLETALLAGWTEVGSGVIIDSAGYIVTNYHLVRDAGQISVGLLDGRTAVAELVGEDVETDLAVLRVQLDALPAAQVPEIPDLRAGDIVLAIGNPFGLGNTVTMGIVSATGRSELATGHYEHFIQTDAAINRGNSGGALINIEGEVIGINTAVLEHEEGAEGIGFAIPIELVVEVLQAIRENGRVIRGWLGATMHDQRVMYGRSVAMTSAPGVVITGVYPNGPADEAGLRFGDRVTHFAGEPVESLRDLSRRIARTPPGTRIPVRVVRGATGIITEAVLIDRPEGRPWSS